MPKLEITTKIGCTIDCNYCPQPRLISNYRKRSHIFDMSMDVFRKCIDKVPSHVNIHFSGMSEPWLNHECTKMFLYANERGHKILASTTLMGMYTEDIELLEKMHFTAFNVHLPSAGDGGEKIEVDEQYLNLLERLLKSRIRINLRFLGETLHSDINTFLKNKRIEHVQIHTRAKNREIKNVPQPPVRHGVIGCRRNFRQNVLLPNGDVVLCCMDYGLQHVLGNLLRENYESLFHSPEFLKIKAGLNNEKIDILCRECDNFAYTQNIFSKMYYTHLREYVRSKLF
ncbi:MAG: SPASM domain-containing protein [Gemmatimonadota bacterium]|nr:MAG: SPASM domain-containing protein [Gemmatimonadota bacterium]